jgi:hypothetical protein
MVKRDNFSSSVKTALAKRAGYRCSFPSCPIITEGPSNESEISSVSIGTACRISSASAGPGARRYDQDMKKSERVSFR